MEPRGCIANGPVIRCKARRVRHLLVRILGRPHSHLPDNHLFAKPSGLI